MLETSATPSAAAVSGNPAAEEDEGFAGLPVALLPGVVSTPAYGNPLFARAAGNSHPRQSEWPNAPSPVEMKSRFEQSFDDEPLPPPSPPGLPAAVASSFPNRLQLWTRGLVSALLPARLRARFGHGKAAGGVSDEAPARLLPNSRAAPGASSPRSSASL